MRFASQAVLINTTIERAGRPVDQLRYLPLVSRDKVWTVLLDATTAQPLAFMPIDSY